MEVHCVCTLHGWRRTESHQFARSLQRLLHLNGTFWVQFIEENVGINLTIKIFQQRYTTRAIALVCLVWWIQTQRKTGFAEAAGAVEH